MSYILQALARSERERRQLEARDLGEAIEAGAAPARASQRPAWLLALGAAAVIALAAGWILVGNDPVPDDGSSATRQQPAGRPAIAEGIAPATPSASATARAQHSPVAPQTADGKRQVASAPLHRVAATPPTEPPDPRTPVADEATAPASGPALEPQRVQTLPGIDVTIHVYSEDPRRRFVYVNGKRYGEGERIDQMNARVQGITRDGLILDLGNRLALLEVGQ